PSDVLGQLIYERQQFRFRPGPVFTNLLLADEVNRTPPKTQAALLEAMEERQVTLEGEPRPLPEPFLVVATQNPVEYEGTYPLPEAELDRFLFKAIVAYPQQPEEAAILRRHEKGRPLDLVETLDPLGPSDLGTSRDEIEKVTVEDSVVGYIVRIVEETRRSGDLQLGASPRAGVHLLHAAKAAAALDGR